MAELGFSFLYSNFNETFLSFRLQRVTFLALHHYLGLGAELLIASNRSILGQTAQQVRIFDAFVKSEVLRSICVSSTIS